MNTDKLKRGLANVGTNIQYAGSSFGSSVVNKLTGHTDYTVDDELISAFEHDTKQIIKAMKFLELQSNRMTTKYWPYVFKSSLRTARVFLLLVGEDSLAFKDMEKYYEAFDRLQSTSEAVQIHPKERQLVIPSIHYELVNFLATFEELEERVLELSETHTKKLKQKTTMLKSHLKHMLKVVKARNKHKAKCAKLEWKTERLAKKKTPLTDQEQHDLDSLQTKLTTANGAFDSINERLKTIIPESLLLVEEFVEELTKWIMCNERQINEEIEKTLRFYAVFHGYVGAKSNKDDSKLCKTYDEIIEKWETEGTAVRLQIESFLKTIYERKPELLDQEVTDTDNRLKVTKKWTLMTLKVTEKLHTVKASDKDNGIFNDIMMADPLSSFKKYQDTSLNVSEIYHPLKILDYDDVYPDLPEALSPPPLPPRDDNRRIVFPVNSPFASPTKVRSVTVSSESSESLDSIHSDSELSIESASELESEIGSTSDLLMWTGDQAPPDRAERQIIKMYNSSKNDITEAPVDMSHWHNLDQYVHTDVFDSTNTVSYKLHALNAFFAKALDHAAAHEKKVLVAKHDFPGVQPGDLSFNAGDEVEVVFDLQSVSSSYNDAGQNWFVGASGDGQHRRTGFAPNTYF